MSLRLQGLRIYLYSAAAGHILCSLVLLYPLHDMWMLCFYFSITFFIRLMHIGSIYSAFHFGFVFIILSACFIYLSYLVALSSHIGQGSLYILHSSLHTCQIRSFTLPTSIPFALASVLPNTSGKLKNAYSCLIILSCPNFEDKKHKQNKWDFLLILDINFIW